LAAERARGVQGLAGKLAILLLGELTPFGAEVDFTGAEAAGQNRLWFQAVEDLPSESIADDEDDHADQDAATEGEQG
jgi:hypothetical protein